MRLSYKACKDRCIQLTNEKKFDDAIVCAHELLDIYLEEDVKDFDNIFHGHYRLFVNSPKSQLYITYMRRIIDIYEDEGLIFKQIDAMYMLASDYLYGNNNAIATVILKRGLEMARKVGYVKGTADFLNGFGNMELNLDNLDKALDYFYEAYRFSIENNYDSGHRFANNIGHVLKVKGNYLKSIEYLNVTAAYGERIESDEECANTYNELGEAYTLNGDYEEAMDYLQRGRKLSESTENYDFLCENYLFTSRLYERLFEHKKALEMFKAYHDLDARFKSSLHHAVLNELEFETEKKSVENENELIRQKNLELDAYSRELDQVNKALHLAFEETKVMQEKAHQSEKYASYNRMVIGIAHRVNTAIGNILMSASFVQKQLNEIEKKFIDKNLKSSELETFLKINRDNIRIMHSSLEKVIKFIDDLNRIPITTEDMMTKQDITSLVGDLKDKYKHQISDYKCQINVRIDKGLPVISGSEILKRVLEQLFDNVFKYAFSEYLNNVIDVEVKKNSKETLIVFKDNGIGLNEESVKNIFDPFFTTNMGYMGGTGLGLYMTHKIVTEILGGDITCSSTLGEGTQFVISIPNRITILESNVK